MRTYTNGQRASKARWYEKNKEYVKRTASERTKAIRNWFWEYKQTVSCTKCGFNHPAALQFHHRVPEEKTDEIAKLIARGWSKDRLLEEIAKCDVLCANCHAIHHYNERYTSIV